MWFYGLKLLSHINLLCLQLIIKTPNVSPEPGCYSKKYISGRLESKNNNGNFYNATIKFEVK